MNKIKAFEQFLTSQSVGIPIIGFVIHFLLAALLAYILGILYIRYGKSLSNRRMFARNFVILACTTMLIISVVKSSLALSLGLVGALSIVRFRAAIKEPEELAYLFLNIAIGLGTGANQWKVTLIGFVLISGFIILGRKNEMSVLHNNLLFTISSKGEHKVDLDVIIQMLKQSCSLVNLKRFDETKDVLEASFVVECDDFNALEKSKVEIQNADKDVKISFLDNTGIF